MKTPVIVNGLPGKMAIEVAKRIANSDEFLLKNESLTGSRHTGMTVDIEGIEVILYGPNERNNFLKGSIVSPDILIVDYTAPEAVNKNADLYCNLRIPFVMGTTGGDRKAMEEQVKKSDISAVIAPNMALPIVSLQAFMQNFARENSGAFTGYKLEIVESHQQGKADTSGTAKAMVKYFNQLGIQFNTSQIQMIRDPQIQKSMGVPEEHLNGHGWHTYKLTAANEESVNPLEYLKGQFLSFFGSNKAFEDYVVDIDHPFTKAQSLDRNFFLESHDSGDLELTIRHNINGRSIYVDGTFEGLRFLRSNLHEKGKTYSMIDVLEAKKKSINS